MKENKGKKYFSFSVYLGESLSRKLVNILRLHLAESICIWNLYGPAETTLGATYYLVDVEIMNQIKLKINTLAVNNDEDIVKPGKAMFRRNLSNDLKLEKCFLITTC